MRCCIRCEKGIKNGNWIRKEIGRSRKIHRENHNLDRCRTQFALVADMEKKWSEMEAIVNQYRLC